MTQKDTSGSWLKRWMEGWWAVGGKKGILWHHRLKLFISQRISFRVFNLNFFRGYVSDPSTPTVYDWLRVFFSKRFFPFEGVSGCTGSHLSLSCLLCQSLISFALWKISSLIVERFCLWNKNTRRTRHVGTIQLNTSYLISFTIQFLLFPLLRFSSNSGKM